MIIILLAVEGPAPARCVAWLHREPYSWYHRKPAPSSK